VKVVLLVWKLFTSNYTGNISLITGEIPNSKKAATASLEDVCVLVVFTAAALIKHFGQQKFDILATTLSKLLVDNRVDLLSG